MQTVQVHLTNLEVDAFNPRKTVDAEAVQKLSAAIGSFGLISPLVVRPALPAGVEPLDPLKTRYGVLCGSRRLTAAKLAGLTSVPCIVRELDDAAAAAVALTEQDNHESLHYLERADGLLRWRDAGASIDEIAETMGWKRAYAYTCIGMAERLTPEAREACFENRLNETIARKLATVPRSAQPQALTKLLEPNHEGKPKTSREAEEVLDGFRRDLAKAPFDATDITLSCSELGGAGSCETCPLRSGTNPDLFPDVQNPNLCTSPVGFQSKADDDWQRRVADGEAARAPKCLEPAQSDAYFNGVGALRDDAPYVEADAICFSDTAQRPYKSLLGAAYKMECFLARVPRKLDVVELVHKQGLDARLDATAKIRRAPAALRTSTKADEGEKLSAEECRERKLKVERRQKAIRKVIASIVSNVAKRGLEKKLLAVMVDSLIFQGAARLTLRRRDVQEDGAKYTARLSRQGEGELLAFLVEATLEPELFGDEGDSKYTDRLKEVAELCGVDPKDAEKEVVAEERAQPVKKEKKDEPPKKARKLKLVDEKESR